MIIKKGTKYRIKNIIPDWDSMGCSQKEYNDKPVEDDGNCVFVIGGKLWIYDDRYCSENEIVELSWKDTKDREIDDIYKMFQGDWDWMDCMFYQYYGLLVEDPIEVEILTDEEYEKTTKNVINLKYYQMVRHKIERSSVVDDLTVKKLLDGYNPILPELSGKLLTEEQKDILTTITGGR